MHSRSSPLNSPCPVFLACATLLAVGQGCFLPVPLAVYPAPTHDSGKTVTFQDQDGERIQKDGILVLQREYYGILSPPTSTQLLDIHDGTVTLPRQWKLSSLWLVWWFGVPWYPVIEETPGENVWLFPFVSGYHHDHLICSSYHRIGRLFSFCSHEDQFEQGSVTLLRNDVDPVYAFIYWDLDFNDITCPTQGNASSDIVLTEHDYARLKSYVDAERGRVRPLVPSKHSVLGGVASQPACAAPPTSQPP